MKNQNKFTKNGRELQEFLGSTKDHTSWAKDQINMLTLKGELDYQVVTEKCNWNNPRPKQTYFFTEPVAIRIANHSQVKSDNAMMVKDNNVIATLALQENEDAILFQAQKILQRRLDEAHRQLEESRLKLEEKSKDFSLALDLASTVIKENDELKPKARYTDEVLRADGCFNTGIIAKELGMSARALNQILHEKGVIYKAGNTWVLYSKYQNKGYQKSETFTKGLENGKSISSISFKWTQEGRSFIHSMIEREMMEAV